MTFMIETVAAMNGKQITVGKKTSKEILFF
jgi:hypothetical protein